MRELRSALSEMRLNDLAVGSDGRNRTLLSAFRSRTGRYQPSQYRVHLRPERVAARPDQAAAGTRRRVRRLVAAGIRHCRRAVRRHRHAGRLPSGDRYLAFAKQAGAVPADATKDSHGPQRELFKQCALAVPYGMEAEGAGPPHWSAGDRRPRAAAVASRNLPSSSGAGPTPRSITPCSPARSRPRSAGRCTSARIPIRGRCGISHAGQRRRDAAARLLLRHRAGHRGVRPDPRRGADLRAARSARRRR